MTPVQKPRIEFHISPFLNLYYSLEVATGSVKQTYNEEYAKRMERIFSKNILEKFAELSESQRFSWRLKSCLFDGISQGKLEKTFLSLATDYYLVLNEAFSNYQQYWERIRSRLENVKTELEKIKEDYQAIVATASDLVNIPLRKKIDVYILDAPTGEPINDHIVGYGVSLPVPFFILILHELLHNLINQRTRVLSRKYVNDEHAEYIDEAILNLVTNSIFSHLKPSLMEKLTQIDKHIKKLVPSLPLCSEKPESVEGQEALKFHEKRNRYIKYYHQAFENDWMELVAKERDFEKVLITLLEKNRDKIRND